MTPDELHEAHLRLGLSAADAARLFQVSDGRVVRYWYRGTNNGRPTSPPGPVVVLTQALIDSEAVREHFGLELSD